MKLAKNILFITSLLAVFSLAGLGCGQKDVTGGIFKSTDQGETWKQMVFVRQDNKDVITIAGLNVYKIVQDNLNRDSFFLATSSGIWRSENGAESWQKIGLNGAVNDLAIDPTNSLTLIVSQGHIIYKTQENFAKIDNIYTDPQNSSIVSVIIDAYNPQRYFAATKSGQLIVSFDAGTTWSTLYNFGRKLKKIYQAPSDTRVLYAVTDRDLYKSQDAGKNWQELTDNFKDFNGASKINDLYIDSRNHLNIFTASDYGILRSSDGGSNWQAISTLVQFGKIPINLITINPNNQSQMYFAISHTIHKSTDGGNSWKTIETVPTARQIKQIILDKNNINTLYLGVSI